MEMVIKVERDLTLDFLYDTQELFKRCLYFSKDYDKIVLDLGDINNIDSIGLGYLIRIYENMRRLRKIFKIKNYNKDIEKIIEYTRLDFLIKEDK